MKRLKLLALAGLSLLALSACTGDKNLAAKDPVTAAKDLTVALKDNDFDRLTHIMAPPDDYTKMEARFKEEQAKKPAPSADESQQFADQLTKFTAPGAEDKLFADIQPKLAQVGPQIPMGVAMVSGMLGQGIANNPKLSETEKSQANTVLTAITKWATTAPLADPDKAKQAIKIVCDTARDLKFTTLADAQKMSFSETMQKVGSAEGGLRKALAVYGFDTDKMLDSVKVEKKSGDDNKAVVTVSYTILDAPVTADIEMVQRDGRWYSADLVKSVEDSLASPAADASAQPQVTGPAMQPAATPEPQSAPAPAMAPAASPADQSATPAASDATAPAAASASGNGG